MPNVFLFFKRPQPTQILRTISGSIAPMILDATVKEGFAATAEPTQHPVEAGADITDHVILKPKTLTLSGIITETPLGDFPGSLVRSAGATVGSQVGAALGPFGKVAGALTGGVVGKSVASSVFGSKDRMLGAIAFEFVNVRDARQPVDIQTGLLYYQGYILSSFTVSRDDKTGGSIKVDLEFKELLLAESRITTVAIPKVKSALNGTNHGRHTAEALDGDKAGKGASLLKQITPKSLGGV